MVFGSLYHLSHLGEERETEFEVITDEENPVC